MTARTRSLLALLAALLLLAGCGNKTDTLTRATTEGPYLDVGPLQYQVQISRQLNPRDPEDREYLEGVPAADAKLAQDQTWFAVFMRVQNESGHAQRAAEDFKIEDTQGTEFTPVALPASNPFAYRPELIPDKGTLPDVRSAAANGAVQQGSMLLFKMNLKAIANRPLVLTIKSPEAPQKQGEVDLDV